METGGLRHSGACSNGTWSHARRMAHSYAAALRTVWRQAHGRWRRSMTECYVELHAASAFSFLDGASQPEGLVERAVELEMPAMALLDLNGFYGSARFHTSATRNGIRAHVGAEIAVSAFGPRLTPPAWLPNQHVSAPARLPLLCESRIGYQNLCQLITQFKMRETTKAEGAAAWNDLEQYASGLVCLTGGDEGPLS